MTNVDDRSVPFLRRLEAARIRLDELSTHPTPATLTEPDSSTGERWDWGQIWAHTAEFPSFWLGQLVDGLARDPAEWPPPFGRVASDPGRVGAIERDRTLPPPELWARAQQPLDRLRDLIAGLGPREWAFQGLHSRLGELPLGRILEEFVVGHLEEHAGQLEGLLEG